jgi:pantoate--beta-alanine ligase
MLPTVTTVKGLRSALFTWREKIGTVALVPTMGALHRGHIALVKAAKETADYVVATIFVNPTQFGPDEDYTRYPRQLDDDKKLLAEAGCDLLYAPTVKEMYPTGFSTTVHPGPIDAILEGACRPGHLTGVTTVVAKLLLQALPDIAFFGEKDYQQLLTIRRFTRDLDIPVTIAGVPIVRDDDGLALSSRNAYLTADERHRALALPRTLAETANAILGGGDITQALADGVIKLGMAGFKVDYLELANAENLTPLRQLNAPARLLAAAKIGTTRLIDNIGVGL